MYKLILFLFINFGALAIGGLLMGSPATNEWYIAQNKAPWTPPGWVFGAAWFFIMTCLSVFMFLVAKKYSFSEQAFFYSLFIVQVVLNIAWNPVFFKYHFVLAGLIIIALLTIVVFLLFWWGTKNMGIKSLLILPYAVWLLIATSLNAFVLVKN